VSDKTFEKKLRIAYFSNGFFYFDHTPKSVGQPAETTSCPSEARRFAASANRSLVQEETGNHVQFSILI